MQLSSSAPVLDFDQLPEKRMTSPRATGMQVSTQSLMPEHPVNVFPAMLTRQISSTPRVATHTHTYPFDGMV